MILIGTIVVVTSVVAGVLIGMFMGLFNMLITYMIDRNDYTYDDSWYRRQAIDIITLKILRTKHDRE